MGEFRRLRTATKGRRPLESCELLKKLDQNFYFGFAGNETIKSPIIRSESVKVLDKPFRICYNMFIRYFETKSS